MDAQALAAAAGTPKKWNATGLIDFLYMASGFLKYGGSFNVTSQPYLGGLTVAPATTAPKIPWLTIGLVGAGVLALVLIVKD
jgi:hypothetical protein